MIKKFFLAFFAFSLFFANFLFAENYIFYYGDGCSHCAKVEKFFQKNKTLEKFDIQTKEIYKNAENRKEFLDGNNSMGIPLDEQGVPTLFIQDGDLKEILIGDEDIINFFENKQTILDVNSSGTVIGNNNEDSDNKKRRAFFAIMLPAAISDSINPCAFAVMLLLLTSILSKSKNRKKAIMSGVLFSLAIFLSYYLMGLGFFTALATSKSVHIIKIIFGSLGILVGLANLKDFFRYGKGFVMEVPFSRRPKMQKIINKVSSPLGAFLVGFLVSLFLLPCSSGPYLTILGYLASQSKDLHLWGYIYLTVYNLIFIIPMIVITLLIGFGLSSVEKLAKLKKEKTKLIHLIVGLLMIGFGIFVLLS